MSKWELIGEGCSRKAYANGNRVKKVCRRSLDSYVAKRAARLFDSHEIYNKQDVFLNPEKYINFWDDAILDFELNSNEAKSIQKQVVENAKKDMSGFLEYLAVRPSLEQQLYEIDTYYSMPTIRRFLTTIKAIRIQRGAPVIFSERGIPIDSTEFDSLGEFDENEQDEEDFREEQKDDLYSYLIKNANQQEISFLSQLGDLHHENYVVVKNKLKICDWGFNQLEEMA